MAAYFNKDGFHVGSSKMESDGVTAGGNQYNSSGIFIGGAAKVGYWDGKCDGCDFAEVFPNGTGVKQENGLIQTLVRDTVYPAREGDFILGVVSGTAGIVLGTFSDDWYLKDDFGVPLRDEDGDYVRNPNVPESAVAENRLKKLDKWTVVGLLGQVYVRVVDDVQTGDYLRPVFNGMGAKSDTPTKLRVMYMHRYYSEKKKYGVARCFIG